MNLVVGIDCGVFAGVRLLDDAAPGFPGYGPDGVATFFGVEVGFKVTLTWASDVRTHVNGTEQRASSLDRPKQHFDGQVMLLGDAPRGVRSKLARYAAANVPFLLGLPHESLDLLDDADGATLAVSPTWLAKSDWAEIGQRVLVCKGKLASTGIIQHKTSSTITLDTAPGDAGVAGGLVMPAMAIYLEPQQDFARFKVAAETWSLSARAAIFDFALPRAGIDLGQYDAAWTGAFIASRLDGIEGNVVDFQLDPDPGNAAGGTLFEGVGVTTIARMKGGTDTLADLAALINSQSGNFQLVGDYDGGAVIGAGDAFLATAAGGASAGNFGIGATLVTYAGLPVWHKPLKNPNTVNDPVHALSEIIDLGGVPYPIGMADYPVYGRALTIESDGPDDWQWLKLFLATVRGAQGVWWLPTYRDDFTWVSSGVLSLTVRTDDESDIGAWYPKQRDRLMVRQTDGTVTYVRISGTPTDNGDGTMTLTIDATLSDEDVEKVSWLEPCRFQGDTFEVTFNGGRSFTMTADAQAHAVTDPDLGEIA
jgi:hypothetical protein